MSAAYKLLFRSRRLVVRAPIVEPMQMKEEHEAKLARVLDVAPPQAYERGADGKRSWWRRALELFGTFRRKHSDVLTREDVAEYRKQKTREEVPVTDPERHLGLRVSRLDDLAKGLVVDGDVDLNDLGDNSEIKDEASGAEANTGYSILTPSDARNHERAAVDARNGSGVERGRHRRLDLGHVRAHAGQYQERRHRRRRQQPLPPVQRGRRADAVDRRERVPVLDRVAARLSAGTGAPNPKGIDFYDRLVDELVAAGIAPFVTLYHWELPHALEDRGGWRSRNTSQAFADYAGYVAERLGSRSTSSARSWTWAIRARRSRSRAGR
jgi:glycosyl hydrolase family 1